MRTLSHRGFVVALVLGAAATLTPRTARAALMFSYDIDSLAFDADEIVLVTKVKAWEDKPQYRSFEAVQVTKSYAGSSLHPGDAFDLETSCYGLAPMFGWAGERGAQGKDTRPPPVVSNDRVLFLKRPAKDAWRAPDDKTKPAPWVLLPSGMRIFVDGRVHAFAQEMNPGCYGPTPGEGPRGAPYTLDAFERALGAAITSAATTHRLLGEPPSADRTTTLLAIAGPAPDAARGAWQSPHERDRNFGRDRIGDEIIQAFGKEGNLDAVLDARARVSRVDGFLLRHGIAVDRVLDAALNTQQPIHRRRAALSLLEEMSTELSEKPTRGAAVARLLRDPEPSLRLQTLSIYFPDKKTPPTFLETILERYPVETDMNVRYALFQRARREGLFERLETKASDMPLTMWKLDRAQLGIEWTTILGSDAGRAEEVVVELRTKERGLVSREVVPNELYGTSASSESAGIHLPLTAPRPVVPGTYDLRAILTIKDDKTARTVKRTIDVGPVELTARLDPKAPVTAASAGAVATASATARRDADASASSETPPETPAWVPVAATLPERARAKAPWILGGIGLAIALDFLRRRARRR